MCNLVERAVIYENETHVPVNRRRSADLEYDRYICGDYFTNDNTIHQGTASAACYVKDNDGHTSLPPFP